jgi:hypothetical protein
VLIKPEASANRRICRNISLNEIKVPNGMINTILEPPFTGAKSCCGFVGACRAMTNVREGAGEFKDNDSV